MRTTTLIAALALLLTTSSALAAEPAKAAPAKPAAGKTVQVTANEDGFVPNRIYVKKGEPLTLVVTRTTEKTCSTEIVVKEYGINQPLPLNKPVAVTFTPAKTGSIRYACGMDMNTGTLIVQ